MHMHENKDMTCPNSTRPVAYRDGPDLQNGNLRLGKSTWQARWDGPHNEPGEGHQDRKQLGIHYSKKFHISLRLKTFPLSA